MNEKKATSGRLRKLLMWLFFLCLLFVGWGRIDLSIGRHFEFSIYGSTWEFFLPLFFLYILCRILERDVKACEFWKDPLLLFGLFALLSVLWNPIKDTELIVEFYLPAILGYFILRYILLKDFELVKNWFWFFYVASINLIVIRAIIQSPDILKSFAMLNSPFMHHNHLAMNILICMPVTAAMSYIEPKRRFYYFISLFILMIGLCLTNSRSGWISFFIMAVYLIWKMKLPKLKYVLLTAVICFTIIVGLFPESRNRVLTLSRPLTDSSFRCRLMMWKVSGYIIRDHPVLGIGFSNNLFMMKENFYAAKLFKKGLLSQPVLNDPHPHNLFLQLLVYLGLTGYMLLFWIIMKTINSFKIIDEKDEKEKVLSVSLKASFIGFIIMNMGDTVLNSSQSILILFLLLAYVFEWMENLKCNAHCTES